MTNSHLTGIFLIQLSPDRDLFLRNSLMTEFFSDEAPSWQSSSLTKLLANFVSHWWNVILNAPSADGLFIRCLVNNGLLNWSFNWWSFIEYGTYHYKSLRSTKVHFRRWFLWIESSLCNEVLWLMEMFIDGVLYWRKDLQYGVSYR